MVFCKGTSRSVLLIGKYALKFPRCLSWKAFVMGMLANINEAQWKNAPNDWHLCPLLYSNKFGLLNIMPRCKSIKHRGLYAVELARLSAITPLSKSWYVYDAKPRNFGMLNGRMVKLDYGN